MAILISGETRAIVQGITGKHGSFHTRLMKDYGTKIVAGVTPGKGGQQVEGVPVFDTVKEALQERHMVDASIVFVPASFAKDAAFEAIENGVRLVVLIAEHIPVHDAMEIKEIAGRYGAIMIGPNTPGLISPAKSKLGIMPSQIFREGRVGVISRSGTLTNEVVNHLTMAGIGQSTCVGIGGDPVTGTSFIEILSLFENDPETDRVVMIGEIGGQAEEDAALFVKKEMSKPVVAYVAGRAAPLGKRMGHAGAIIERGMGTARSKVKAFREQGIPVAEFPWEVSDLMSRTRRS